MKKIIVLIALFISMFAIAQRKDKLILVDKDDPVMELAFAEAKQTLDEFISRAVEKRSENETYGAYIKVVEGEAVEYLWVSNFQKYDDTYFMGVLITKPALISQFEEGATVGVLKEDIYDWQIYNKETDMTEGAFTFKVLKKNK